MRLAPVEQLVLREAEEERARAMQHLEQEPDGIVLAQLLGSMGELYSEAGNAIALRVRADSAKRRKVRVRAP